RNLWHRYKGDPLSHELYPKYFRQYFKSAGNLDKYGIMSLLTKDSIDGNVQFRTAAEKFKIINDDDITNIFVPYGTNGGENLDLLRAKGPERYLMRKLQRYCVSVHKNDFRKLKNMGSIEEIHLGVWVCITNAYDNERGLLV